MLCVNLVKFSISTVKIVMSRDARMHGKIIQESVKIAEVNLYRMRRASGFVEKIVLNVIIIEGGGVGHETH